MNSRYSDNSYRSGWLVEQYKELIAATRFLSIIPLPGSAQLFRTDTTERRVILGSAYFPIVGLLLAFGAVVITWIFGSVVPQLVLSALLVVALVILTGGLHLDGLMDTCDGFFGGKEREDKLEIMRDSRVGSFGVLGAGCVLLLKFALLASIDSHTLPTVLFTILPITRWELVLVMCQFPSARQSGLGAALRRTVTPQRLGISGALSLVCALLFGHFLLGMVLWFAGSALAYVLGIWLSGRLGGLTGDTYGAISEVSEVVLLLIFLLIHSWI
ncbi:MAG TPA: adenosylcobinamide-GDP ribazoletransferase [Dictyobacter sp.]|jgi:adenosylcobinamide-GDP ribazoletransferase|nr:adenosylcobinamide-GDP ribazoletransferase [Dictyobacter sp.]